MLAKFLGYPKNEGNLNRTLALASNNPFKDSLSGNNEEPQTPKVFAATSGPIVKETIDSGSPFAAIDAKKHGEPLVGSPPVSWETIFADLPQAIVILDQQQRVLFTNAAQIELTGDDARGFEGGIQSWLQLLCPDPEHANKTINSFQEHVWRNKLTRVFDLNCKGTPRQIEFRPSTSRDGHVILVLSDSTEDKTSGEALRQANFKFRSLFGNSAGGVVLVDQNGTIKEVNQAFTDFADLASSSLVGKPFLSLINADDAEKLSKAEISHVDKISDKKRKIRFTFPNSEQERPALVTPSYIFDENKAIIHRIYQLKPRDKQLMEKLKDLSAKAQALLSAVPDMFVLVDPNGIIKDWSPPAEVWDHSCPLDSESINKTAKQAWPEFGEFIESNIENVFEQNKTIHHKLESTENDGNDQYQCSMTFAPFGGDLALVLIEKPVSLHKQDSGKTPATVGSVNLGATSNWQNRFVSGSKTALCVADAEGSLLQINPAATNLFGQVEAALLRSNLFQLLSKAPGTDDEFDLDGFAKIEFEKTWSNLLSVSQSGPKSVVATVMPIRKEDGELDCYLVTVEPKAEVQTDPLSDERELAQSQFRSQLQIATSLFSITPESRDPVTFNTWLMRLKVLAESMTNKKRVGVVHLMRDVADQVTSISGNGRGLREVVISGSSALTIENEAATTFALLVGEVMHMGVSSSGPEATGPSIYIDVEGYEGDIVLTAKPGEDRSLFTADNKDNAKVIEILIEQLRGKISVGVGEDESQPPSIRLAFPAPQT